MKAKNSCMFSQADDRFKARGYLAPTQAFTVKSAKVAIKGKVDSGGNDPRYTISISSHKSNVHVTNEWMNVWHPDRDE